MFEISGYRTTELLTSGGGRQIFRGVRLSDELPVILKVVREDLDALEREQRLRQHFDPQYTVQMHAIERRADTIILVLEDFGGRPLSALIGSAALTLETRLRIAVKLAAGLAGLHRRGYVHRDINPSNIIVNLSTSVAKLNDFSLCCKLSEAKHAGSPGRLKGTVEYMAGEQTGRPDWPCDHRADLYSAGVTLFELFTGILPFQGKTPAEFVHSHIAVLPPVPDQLTPAIPSVLSRLILTLLAKSPNDRYQSAQGLVADLDRMLSELRSTGEIANFELRGRDNASALKIPERLYGRQDQSAGLWGRYRAARQGNASMVLVTGPSGVGKTALVNNFQRKVQAAGGTFVSGKFDLLGHDLPFAAIVQGLETLIAGLLSESDERLAHWRRVLLSALGTNGQLIVDVVPSLGLVIGDQSPTPDLRQAERAHRFTSFFLTFISAFCRPESPLVLFLDDLQWADQASLNLIRMLLSRASIRHLLVVGSLRDDETSDEHHVRSLLGQLNEAQTPVVTIQLAPLETQHVAHLLANTLRQTHSQVDGLAGLVTKKTGGVPFFVRQFLVSVAEAGHLSFLPSNQTWGWDLESIGAQVATDNVVELMVQRLNRLPKPARDTLSRAACLGGEFAGDQLERITAARSGEIVGHLETAIDADLLKRIRPGLGQNRFAFLHDRVQQVAYGLLEPAERAQVHLNIAQDLIHAANAGPFEVVGHLNAGRDLLLGRSFEERRHAALMNLRAARRAASQTAFVSAVGFLEVATELLSTDGWEQDWDTCFAVHLELLRNRLATDPRALETEGQELLKRARSVQERVEVLNIHTWKLHNEGAFAEALALELETLVMLGVNVPETTSDIHGRAQQLRSRIDELEAQQFEQLAEMPGAQPDLDLTRLLVPMLDGACIRAFNLGEKELFELLVLESLSLALEYGRSPETALALAFFASLQEEDAEGRARMQEFRATALALSADHSSVRMKVDFVDGFLLSHWEQPLVESQAIFERIWRGGREVGDRVWASNALWQMTTVAFSRGAALSKVAALCERNTALALDSDADYIAALCDFNGTVVACLASANSEAAVSRLHQGLLKEPYPDDFVQRSFRGVCAAVVLYFFGDNERAWALSSEFTAPFHVAVSGSVLVPHGLLFHGLIASAVADTAEGDLRLDLLSEIADAVATSERWAGWMPTNYAAGHLLLRAEWNRIRVGDLRVLDDYDAAIDAAQEGPAYIAALAHERAARFLLSRGKVLLSQPHLSRARAWYLRWGATAKAHALAIELRKIGSERLAEPWYERFAADQTTHESLDFHAVMQAVQAISSELDRPRLLAVTIKLLAETAGAERGVLLLEQSGKLAVAASVDVKALSAQRRAFEGYPERVTRWVQRTGRAAVLADAAASPMFAQDPYIQARRPLSILCMPLLGSRGAQLGVVFLENNLTAGVFSRGRLEFLKMLLAQTGVSLENAQLFAENSQIESDLRAAYDIIRQSPIIVFSWGREHRWPVSFVSENVLPVLGYDTSDFLSGRVAFTEIIHPDDLLRVRAEVDVATETGHGQVSHEPYRVVTKQGGIRWVECHTNLERDGLGEVVHFRATVADVTEKRRLLAQFHQAQKMEAIGRLAGGVAHDFNNLLTVIIGNAAIIRDELPEKSPLLQDVNEITTVAQRAAALTQQLLTFSRKEVAIPRLVQMEHVISDMLRMLQRLIDENITLEFDYSDDLSQIRIDPSQLEQIVLNLAVNARDAMPDGGVLRIEAANLPGRGDDSMSAVRLTVSDTGVGMTDKVREHIFEPFFTTKPEGQGTGLGLATVHGIVTQNGGVISLRSALGVGTAFDILFPRADDAPLERTREPECERVNGDEMVLIIEDEPMVLEATSRVLRQFGYETRGATSLDEALECAQIFGDDVDLILSDVVLKSRDGPDVVQQLAALCPKARVMFMSGHGHDVISERGVLLNDTSFIQKPFLPRELARKIRQVLDEDTGSPGLTPPPFR